MAVFAPSVQDHLRLDDRREDVTVQAFIAQFAIETFDKRIFSLVCRAG